MEYTGDYQKG